PSAMSSGDSGGDFARSQMRRMDGMNRARAGQFLRGRSHSLALLLGLSGLVCGIYSFTLLRMRQDDLALDPDFTTLPPDTQQQPADRAA
ncbi:hypothetical protein BOX15_Mlig024977g1, partial [Macrostomum lignano]